MADSRFDHAEPRYATPGLPCDTMVVIAHTGTAGEIRVIPMRKATRHEQILYFHNL